MIFTRFDENGNLVISATELVERLAMEAFETKRKQGKTKFIIEYGQLLSIERLVQMMGNDMVAFRKWEKQNSDVAFSATFSDSEVSLLEKK